MQQPLTISGKQLFSFAKKHEKLLAKCLIDMTAMTDITVTWRWSCAKEKHLVTNEMVEEIDFAHV